MLLYKKENYLHLFILLHNFLDKRGTKIKICV